VTASAKKAPYGEASVTLTRVFDAPRALVWKAWTDPQMMAQWFGPRGFTSTVPELDVRVGGALRIVMHGPDGNDYPMKGTFSEVLVLERLVFSTIAIDKDGNHLLEGETTVTFVEKNGKTTLTLRTYAMGLVPIAPNMLAGMEAGWTQSIDKLQELVARGG
jgi:uncharacterized protein YndB with AHSA1/START domain